MARRWLNIAALAIILPLITPASHAGPQDELAATSQAMNRSRLHAAQLAEQHQLLENELRELQKRLVQLAEHVQEGEAELSGSEEKLRILNEQLEQKNPAMVAHRKQMAALIEMILRLSRTPPEAVILMPGDSMNAMKVSRALSMASENIRQESASLKAQLDELQALKTKVADRQKELVTQQQSLDKERQALATKNAERQALQSKLGLEQQKEKARLDQLAKKAEDLKALMAAIEKQEKERAHEQARIAAMEKTREPHETAEIEPEEHRISGDKGKLRSFASAKGKIRPPVAGKVIQSFGASVSRNETSKGMVIAARPQAEVTAPFDAEVVFAGYFMDYGKMVILRHSDEYHTLLAGLTKIGVHTGEFLLEGEPIGAMGDNALTNRLYMELRKNNQPTDPAPWLKGLAKEN